MTSVNRIELWAGALVTTCLDSGSRRRGSLLVQELRSGVVSAKSPSKSPHCPARAEKSGCKKLQLALLICLGDHSDQIKSIASSSTHAQSQLDGSYSYL